MANRRTRRAQQFSSNGVAIGGMATLRLAGSYRSVVVSAADGAFGAEDVDRGGLAISVDMQCTDVTKILALLDAVPGSTTWREQESGALTYANYTIDGAVDGQIVWTGASLRIPKEADGTVSFKGAVRLLSGTKTLKDFIAAIRGNATAQALTYPARLFRAKSATFDPDGAGSDIVPVHIEEIGVSLDAEVLEDYDGNDVGMTAVDRGEFAPMKVDMAFKDSGADASGNSEIGAELVDAGKGSLAVVLSGRGGAADKTLTAKNVLWTGYERAAGKDFTQFTARGSCGWRNGGTQYDLSGTPILTIV